MEILITGYSKLPKGTTAQINYDNLAICMVLDRKTGLILDFDCSLITKLAKNIISEIIIGIEIKEIELLQDQINKKYFGSAQKAIVSGIKDCYNKYIQIINKK